MEIITILSHLLRCEIYIVALCKYEDIAGVAKNTAFLCAHTNKGILKMLFYIRGSQMVLSTTFLRCNGLRNISLAYNFKVSFYLFVLECTKLKF